MKDEVRQSERASGIESKDAQKKRKKGQKRKRAREEETRTNMN